MDPDPLQEFLISLADRITGLKGDERHAAEDLEFYSRYVVGWNNSEFVGNSQFIKKVYETLQYSDDEDILILGPRGSAKSTCVSVTYTTWVIGNNPLIRILLAVSSVESQGLAFGRQITHILENNDRYISIFGDLVPPLNARDKWSETEKIVMRPEPPGGLKDPTLGIVGVGSNVPSKRSDIVIVDDVVTALNAYSPVQRSKVESFVFQTLFPTVIPGGRRIVVGSRWDPRDLYSVFADRIGVEFPKSESIVIEETY